MLRKAGAFQSLTLKYIKIVSHAMEWHEYTHYRKGEIKMIEIYCENDELVVNNHGYIFEYPNPTHFKCDFGTAPDGKPNIDILVELKPELGIIGRALKHAYENDYHTPELRK